VNVSDLISDDFDAVVDGLETIQVVTPSATHVVPKAKRRDRRNAREAVSSLGLYVEDFVEFVWTDLGFDVPLGSTVVDPDGRSFVVTSSALHDMTNKRRVQTVSLSVVTPDLCDVLQPATYDSKGKYIPWKVGLPIRLVLSHQSPAEDNSAILHPQYRAYVRTDSSCLPFPEKAVLRCNGKLYDVLGLQGMDRLAGFAALDLHESHLGEVVE